MNASNKYVVEIDGEQVYTANWVHAQMLAQSCRIDRANSVAVISSICSIISLITAIVAIAL